MSEYGFYIGPRITRDEHLAWCKARAREYLYTPNWQQAFDSMVSDLAKHDETADHAGIKLGVMLLCMGDLKTSDAMRKWIDGFN